MQHIELVLIYPWVLARFKPLRTDAHAYRHFSAIREVKFLTRKYRSFSNNFELLTAACELVDWHIYTLPLKAARLGLSR
jgi:hypothetical protein